MTRLPATSFDLTGMVRSIVISEEQKPLPAPQKARRCTRGAICVDPQQCDDSCEIVDDSATRLDVTDRYESHAEYVAKRGRS